ncbi:MAG: hypothetical protein IT307_10320 [Chloroflexi bacterium]|nr:hypothetical protein [Chloroflexota bacterium]
MRALLALTATLLALASLGPTVVGAQTAIKKYDNKQQKIYFEVPSSWSLGPNTPHGVLPNEVLTAQARDKTTEFDVALYKLAMPITDDTFDQQMSAFDDAASAYVLALPDGNLLDSSDIVVDDADGRIYKYQFTRDGNMMYGETILVAYDDVVGEITQTALDAEYNAKQQTFDEIFASLTLPWSPPS